MNDAEFDIKVKIITTLENINARLDSIESRLDISSPVRHSHPSLDKIKSIENVVNRIFDQQTEKKTCAFEPNGKPCDQCSMCNSRGF